MGSLTSHTEIINMKAMCETGPTVYSILILIREVLPFADANTSTALLRSYKTMSVGPAANLISFLLYVVKNK